MGRKRKYYTESKYVGKLGSRLREFSPFVENGNEFEWRWCLHCERAFMVRDMRVFHEVPSEALRGMGEKEWDKVCCAYEDCDGTLIDAWGWDGEWRREMGILMSRCGVWCTRCIQRGRTWCDWVCVRRVVVRHGAENGGRVWR